MAHERHIKAVLFDVYNTLIDIRTEEHSGEVWHNLARVLRYQGLEAEAHSLRDAFFVHIRAQQRESGEQHPEVNLLGVFRALLRERGHAGPEAFVLQITQLFRALSMRRFRLFPDVLPTLQALRARVKLGVISDAQRVFIEPEMQRLGLTPMFDVRIISGDHGFRKPDARLFRMALASLDMSPDEAVYVGDNNYRDVCGAQGAGLWAVLIQRAGQPVFEDGHCRPDAVIRTLQELVARQPAGLR